MLSNLLKPKEKYNFIRADAQVLDLDQPSAAGEIGALRSICLKGALMKSMLKSLFLAAPATVALAAGAGRAADLPAYKSAPVDYVRVCDVYGAGFFYIPGTDTCLSVGGYVRAEYKYVPGRNIYSVAPGSAAVTQFGGTQDTTGMEVRGRVDLDARTQTAMGHGADRHLDARDR